MRRVGWTRALRTGVVPLVWVLAALLLVAQPVGGAFGALLDAYNRGAMALGGAALHAGRWLVELLGPAGRWLRRLAASIWRRPRQFLRRLNVQILRRMFRPWVGWVAWSSGTSLHGSFALRGASACCCVGLNQPFHACSELWKPWRGLRLNWPRRGGGCGRRSLRPLCDCATPGARTGGLGN
jgi:hypothetical protein